MTERIIDKIRKLLALAADATEPNEAALAAERAQALMIEHAIEEEAVRGKGGESAPSEPIETELLWDYRVPKTWNKGTSWEKKSMAPSKIPQWHVQLAGAMARSFLCRVYYTSGREITMVGRRSAREVFSATYFYVRSEIEKLCNAGWKVERDERTSPSGAEARRWKTAFYSGAVSTISTRLRDSMKKLEAGTGAPAPAGVSSSGLVLAPPLGALPGPSNPQTAIVLRGRQEEVDAWVKAKVKLGAGRSGTYHGGRDGYAQGKAAGHAVSLDKRATRRLGS
jgi:hypothetical protein